MLIDTLTIAQNLIAAGIPDAHAQAIAKEYANLMQTQIDQFATKQDLKHVEVRLVAKIDTRCNELDKKIDTRCNALDKKIDTKFNELDKKIDTRCNELDKKIDTRFNELDRRIDRLEVTLKGQFEQQNLRILVVVGGSVATMGGLVVGAIKLLLT